MEAIPSLISRQTALTDYQMPHRVQLRPKIGIFLLEGCHIKEKHIRHRGGDTLEGFVEVSAPSSLSSSSYDVKISFEGMNKSSQLELSLMVYRNYQNMARL